MPTYVVGAIFLFFNRAQSRLTDFKKRLDYLCLFLVGLIPIILSIVFHVGLTHRFSYPSPSGPVLKDCVGYLQCVNWSSLVLARKRPVLAACTCLG
jgi:hypothetical protein